MLKGNKIGEGTYGKVYKATHRSSKEDYAVKRNLIERVLDFAGSVRELDILSKLVHPHIVSLEFMSVGDPFIQANLSPLTRSEKKEYKDDKIHFIFPLAEGNLDDLINGGSYGYGTAQKYMVHILLATEYMHSQGIIHRDLKPHNILNYNGVMQICDFGLAKPYTPYSIQSPRIVTSWYRAPEVTLGIEDYTYKIDSWSLGCIMYEIIAKKPFINGVSDNNKLLLNKITSRLPDKVPDNIFNFMVMKGNLGPRIRQQTRKKKVSWNAQLFGSVNPNGLNKYDFIDLISKVLTFDPDDRLDVTQILNHKFFDSYRDYIEETRKDFPLEPPSIPKIECIKCNERTWAIQTAYSVFNDRNTFDWYRHRILFQAIDIFDRYLIYLSENTSNKMKQNNSTGMYMDKYKSKLSFLVCLYLSIKYFVGNIYPISFSELVERNYKTLKARKIADELEINLIKNVLEYNIYRPTMYDVATKKLTDNEIIYLLYVIGDLHCLDSSLNIKEVFDAFELANKEKV